MTHAPGAARPRLRPGVLAWTLWALGMLVFAVVPWSDHLLRQAGRADLVQLTPGTIPAVLATLSASTVGAVLASRRPRHPVGWLLLGVALSLSATAATAQYFVYGLLVRPGPCQGPSSRRATSRPPPSSAWRWWAWVMAAAQVVLLMVVTATGGPLDPRPQALGGPFDFRGMGGVLLIANQADLAVTSLAVVVAAGSLVVRFRRATGIERQQLRWVALAAALVVVVAAIVVASLALGAPSAVGLAAGVCLALVPVAIGAAVLRCRLYDLDRIVSRTLAYGVLTVLLGGGYAVVVLGLGALLGRRSSLVVAGATLAVAAAFQPARRRVQRTVDQRFNRRRYDAARTIDAFSARLREQTDLDTLSTELLAVVDQTMQPTQVWLWLRPSPQR